ncbi:unnamed protein product [Fusarium graminearum]|nr:unnamed protein product [Fusarium graminearum]
MADQGQSPTKIVWTEPSRTDLENSIDHWQKSFLAAKEESERYKGHCLKLRVEYDHVDHENKHLHWVLAKQQDYIRSLETRQEQTLAHVAPSPTWNMCPFQNDQRSRQNSTIARLQPAVYPETVLHSNNSIPPSKHDGSMVSDLEKRKAETELSRQNVTKRRMDQ